MQATANGIQMAYTDDGAGVPLLLIHGFPLCGAAWSRQVAAFKNQFRVLVPDLRGFGASPATEGPVAMSRYAEDLQALIQHLALEPVLLAGHSMGGYVALAFAKAYPQALRGLVLVGSKAAADTPEAAAARLALAERVRVEGASVAVAAMAPKMLAAGNGDAAMAAAVRAFMAPSQPQGVISALLGMADRPAATPWLDQIRVPTLVIAGVDDALIPPAEAESLAAAIPGAQLALIPEAGHLVAFEQPEAFNEALRGWLAHPSGQPT